MKYIQDGGSFYTPDYQLIDHFAIRGDTMAEGQRVRLLFLDAHPQYRPSHGEVIDRMCRLFRDEHDGYEDIDRFHAPSECYAVVLRGINKQRKQLLAEANLSPEAYNAIVLSRVSHKWAHDHGALIDEEDLT